MAGSPTCGKISTGMRRMASAAQSAMATRATTTVIGLDRAARTRRTMFSPRDGSLAYLDDKGLNIPGGGGDAQQAAPDAESRQCVVDLGLREQPLGFRHVVNVSEA